MASCTHCGRLVAPPVGRDSFFCPYCGALQNTAESEALADDAAARPAAAAPLRPVDLSRYEIDRDSDRDTLHVRWKWGTWTKNLPLLGITVFWNTITWTLVLSFFFLPDEKINDGNPPPVWFMVLFFTPFVLIGVAMIYSLLTMAMNRSHVWVQDGLLGVHHGPIYWKAPPTIETGLIRQLFVQLDHDNGSTGAGESAKLSVLTRDSRVVDLIKGDDGLALRGLERLVETHLGIDDQPVEGEL